MKKVFSTMLAAIMVFTMLALPVFATDIEDGSEAYVTVGSMNVTKNPTPSGSISVVYQNEKLTVLEAYINGKDQIADNYHKVQLKDGTIGYVYAYAIKNQGARSDLTSSQVGTKLRADEKVAKDSGESRNQVQRFVRLTNLVPELLDMVDEKKISFNPAVELSYLDEKQQQDFLEAMDASQNAPSLSQAIRIKKLAQQGEFDYDAVYNIMNEEKKSELDTVTIKNETLRKYFPRNYTPRQMESIIIKLLDQWQLKKQQAKQKKQEEAR